MPFSSFRERLGSTSKHERDLQQQHAGGALLSTTHSSEGNSSSRTTSRSSTSDPSNSSAAAIQALKAQPLSADPVQFVQDALTPLFTFNPKHDVIALDDVIEYHIPRYFAPHYRHSFNLNDADMHGWIARTRIVRQNCQKLRVRFIKALVDTSEHQSMQHALVSLLYEVVVTVPYRDEDIRLQAHGVYKIEHGKLTQAMVVMELHEAMLRAPDIPACVIA